MGNREINRNPTMDYFFANMTDEKIKLHLCECDWDERMSTNVGIPDYLNHPDTHNTLKSGKLKLQYMCTEERMEQIREKVYHLKAKREAERQEYVKKCCDRQWRDT